MGSVPRINCLLAIVPHLRLIIVFMEGRGSLFFITPFGGNAIYFDAYLGNQEYANMIISIKVFQLWTSLFYLISKTDNIIFNY